MALLKQKMSNMVSKQTGLNIMNTVTRNFHAVMKSQPEALHAGKFKRSFAAPSKVLNGPTMKSKSINKSTLYGFDLEAVHESPLSKTAPRRVSEKDEVSSVWME